MSTPQEILGQMIAVADEQTANLQTSIDQVQDQIDEYLDEIDGVENGLCGVAETDLTGYLDSTKVIELSYLDADHVDYGPNYGNIDYTDGGITDFSIIDTTGNIIYKYLGINWDGDTIITKLITDFAFGNDYITRPLTSGATYGLQPNVDALTDAKSILIQNKNKISNSKTIFEDYT